MNAKPRTPMPLTDISATTTDAGTIPPTGGSCACCMPKQTGAATFVPDGAVPAAYAVAGLTCGSCVDRVRDAIKTLDGVLDVHITLVPGGTSPVSVISSQRLTRTSVQDVVEEAGYQLTTA